MNATTVKETKKNLARLIEQVNADAEPTIICGDQGQKAVLLSLEEFNAWQDYLWFQEHNRPLLKRINDLIKDAQRSPFRGLGKPEPLRGELSGYWSRRINAEHRLVYSVSQTELTIISCRFHYER